MIMVLAGTKDGRIIAEMLEKAGLPVLATAATSLGEDLLREGFSGKTLCGLLDESKMEDVIKRYEFGLE